jgi:hypothetical protein
MLKALIGPEARLLTLLSTIIVFGNNWLVQEYFVKIISLKCGSSHSSILPVFFLYFTEGYCGVKYCDLEARAPLGRQSPLT